MALGTWRPPDDPTVHGTLTLRCDRLLEYRARAEQAAGHRVTLTHLMVKIMGDVFREIPEANRIVRWGRLYQREKVDVFVHVAMTDPTTGKLDLSGLVVRNADARSLFDIAQEVESTVHRVRANDHGAMTQSRRSFQKIPSFLVRPALNLMAFLTYTLNLDLSAIGVPKDAFGSLAITNVGALGLDTAYVPLVPYTRLPVFIALGAVKEGPVVEDGALVVGRTLSIHVTFDHRIMDGSHAAQVVNAIKKRFADPDGALGTIPPS